MLSPTGALRFPIAVCAASVNVIHGFGQGFDESPD
jgi:hypothetical protein